MVLTTDNSKAQIFTLLALTLIIAIIGATGVVLDSRTAVDAAPETTDTSTPEMIKTGNDIRQSIQQQIVLSNYNTSCETCNVEEKINQDIEPTLNNLYATQGKQIEISNIDNTTGEMIKYRKSNQGSKFVSSNGTHITGGVSFSPDDIADTDRSNAMEIKIKDNSNSLNVFIYNSSKNNRRFNVSVEDRGGDIVKNFTILPNKNNTVDIGSGTVNGNKLYSNSGLYTDPSRSVTDVEIITDTPSNTPNVVLVASEFDNTGSEPTTTVIQKVTYDLTVEDKKGYIKQTNTVYHGQRK